MITKFFKTIHNKYQKFFKFVFFLRYVFIIFLISIISFISIPKFFNYEKKQDVIRKFLNDHYDLIISNYDTIEYNIFPFPNISLENVDLNLNDEVSFFDSEKLNIILNLKDIYNYKTFNANKITLENNVIKLDIDKAETLTRYFNKLKKRVDIKNLNIDFSKNNKSIIKLQNIDYSNYGEKSKRLTGKVFNNEFKVLFDEDYQKINIKIFDTGININFDFDKINYPTNLTGSTKISILDNYIKLNFLKKNNQFKIKNSNFRNKNLSILFNGILTFDPFFEINSNILIKKINQELIKKINIQQILENKEIIKKINGTNKVNYNKSKPGKSLFTGFETEFSFEHGKLVYFGKIFITGGFLSCHGDSLLTEEYPRLNFDCNLDINNKQKFLKKFSLKEKLDDNETHFAFKGSINILNNKINFTKILKDKSYLAKDEELDYFKKVFENVLLEKNFINIFEESKIENFIIEIL